MDASHASKSHLSRSSHPACFCFTEFLAIAGFGISNVMKFARPVYDVPAPAANAMDTRLQTEMPNPGT
jgi:hypothetical protein